MNCAGTANARKISHGYCNRNRNRNRNRNSNRERVRVRLDRAIRMAPR